MESNKIIYNICMDEDNLNIEIRKFLKKVGITSQREIEKFIRNSIANGSLRKVNLLKFQ